MEEEVNRGKAHMTFRLDIYGMQLAAKRHFMHEHPERSKVWDMSVAKHLLLRPEINAVVIHTCACGMTGID